MQRRFQQTYKHEAPASEPNAAPFTRSRFERVVPWKSYRSRAVQLTMLILILLTSSVCRAVETTADLYVSTKGSDSWSGTLAEPNTQGSDGPFATLAHARDAVRKSKKQKTTDIVVLIRDGKYQLEQTVVFGLGDSGAGETTVTYAAYPGETPVFSSGQEIKGWQHVRKSFQACPRKPVGK